MRLCAFCVYSVTRTTGWVSERSKETVLKTVVGKPTASSNLASSANRVSSQSLEALFSSLASITTKSVKVDALCTTFDPNHVQKAEPIDALCTTFDPNHVQKAEKINQECCKSCNSHGNTRRKQLLLKFNRIQDIAIIKSHNTINSAFHKPPLSIAFLPNGIAIISI